MVVIGGRGGRTASAVVMALVSCACTDENFSGFWQGLMADASGPLPATMSLTQQGRDVAGQLADLALVGRVDGDTLSFSVTGAGLYCAFSGNGSATMISLPDRNRVQLSYFGADSCGGTFNRLGSFDRLRCPADMLACYASYYDTGWVPPYCANGQTDGSNCGQCGLRCGEFQACLKGACQVPACTSPVRLQAPLRYPAAQLPVSLALGDLNGDGVPDAVVASSDTWYMEPIPAAVSALLGDGRGGFGLPIPTEVTAGPVAVALGDLDRDGRVDAAVYGGAWMGPATVTILLGNGDGSFRPGTAFPAGAEVLATHVVALADLNGDGALDLVLPGPTASVQVRLGAGDGTFGPGQLYDLPGNPRALLASDLDGDGRVDLALASHPDAGPVVSVLLGNGDGTFRRPVDFAGVQYPRDIAVGDFDEDGAPDLVVAGGYYNWEVVLRPAVAVLFGNGDGTFAAPIGVVERQAEEALGLAVADLDGDGHQDVAAATGNEFEVVLGNGDGTFAAGVRFPVPAPNAASSGGAKALAAANLDGGAAADLVVLNWEQTVSVFLACSP